jgi:glycosyltransferase involved in cell wall biosynthesis
MPGPLDFMMAAAARRAGARVVILVHDADSHPGDGFPLQMWLQRRLCHAADAIAYLSAHVGERLKAQKITSVPLIQLSHPPMSFGVPPLQPHNGPLRLLHFGRLLPYKGLDLLAGALASLGPRPDLTVRVVGSGPAGPELDALNHMPNVTVENRWVPEEEVRDVLTWADALVLPYREASQSGVAAAALAAGRAVVSTNVGGLAEQLGGSDRALLCEPTTEGLANGLRTLLENPPAATGTFEDPATAWRDMAASLLRQARALPAPG